jgi:hypothetical protein
MIHLLLTWTLMILAPEVVEGRFLALVLAGMAVGRCDRSSRCVWPYPEPCDEPPSLGDAQDCLGMTVVAVDRRERWTHLSKWSQLHPFDQTDVSFINLVHPSCAHGKGLDLGGRGTGQVRPHLVAPAAPAGPVAPVWLVVPGGAVVPGSCVTLVPPPP